MKPALAALFIAWVAQENPLLDPSAPGVNKEAPAEFKVRLETTKGEIVLHVVRSWAPKGADRFFNLVKNGYYDDTRFFRVVPKFVAQWGLNGDPKITAKWREAKIDDDPVKQSNTRGMVSFAKSGPNSRTAQLFINLKDNSGPLDPQGFSPFAEVASGMEIVDKLHSGYGGSINQTKVIEGGNAFLDKEYKDLDRLTKATILP
jgi:peptidyl-prolyl cis-trans isomerase A (cyclophilin A)